MKVWKLVSGILSIILTVIVLFQSCAAGVVEAVEDSGGTSGGAGVVVAILMLAGGIVSIATRKSNGKGGNIALIVLFGIAAIMGFSGTGIFKDLIVWSAWCMINAILALVAIFLGKKNSEQENNNEV